jgi:hypothetical protein
MKRKAKKRTQDEQIPNPLRVDANQFTDAIRRMVNTSPLKRSEIPHRKNPHKGPLIPPMK